MKKFYVLFLIMIILFASQLEAQKYGIKVVTGSFSGKRPGDEWINTTNFFNIRTQPAASVRGGVDFSVEAFYFVIPQFSLSIGISYLEKGFEGNRGEFTYPETSGLSGGFMYNPECKSSMYPLTLTGTFLHRLNDKMILNVMGGGGYYFGKISCFADNFDRIGSNPAQTYAYLPEFFRADLKGFGFHFGLGVDLNLSDNTYFIIEALYKSVIFKDLESESVRSSDQSDPILAQYPETLMIEWRVSGDETGGNIVYRINRLDYSGVQMRVGLKFRF